MATLEERTISGRGLLRLSGSADLDEARLITLFAWVFRRPTNEYLNLKYNPPRGFYATLNFMREGALIRSETLEFPFQAWDFAPEKDFQNLYALSCAYDGILQSFVNLGASLGVVPISVQNNIQDFRHTALWFDEIKIVCYADTAIKLLVESKPYDLCPNQVGIIPDEPPAPPVDVFEVAPGTPLTGNNGISQPYDGASDDGDSVPASIDDPNASPPGNTLEGDECSLYQIEVTIIAQDSNIFITSPTVFAPYSTQVRFVAQNTGDVFTPPFDEFNGFGYALQIYCRGLSSSPGGCQIDPGWFSTGFVGVTSGVVDATVTNVTPL